MVEIAVVGKEEFVTGFRLAGVRKVHEVSGGPAELERELAGVMGDKEVGIVVVLDSDFRMISAAARQASLPRGIPS